MIIRILAIILLAATVYAQDVVELEFAWDAYSDPNAIGLRLKMADTSGGPYNTVMDFATSEVGGTVEIDIEPGTIKYFVMTAYSATKESGPSNEVSFFLPALPPDSGSITVPTQLRIKLWEHVLSQ